MNVLRKRGNKLDKKHLEQIKQTVNGMYKQDKEQFPNIEDDEVVMEFYNAFYFLFDVIDQITKDRNKYKELYNNILERDFNEVMDGLKTVKGVKEILRNNPIKE